MALFSRFSRSAKRSAQNARFSWIVIALFLVVFGIRVLLALYPAHFSGDEAYFTLRQIEAVRETGLPLYDDPLSFGGRQHLFAPLFYYLMAGLNVFFPVAIVGKVLVNLFAATLMMVIYGITKKITHNEQAALFSAFVGSFIPIYFTTTLNTFSITAVVFPLLFLVVYLYLSLEKQGASILFLLLFFVLTLTHYAGVLFLIAWVVYLILLKLEDLSPTAAEIEIGLCSLFLFLWTNLLIYKDAFLQHGIGVIWQNLPPPIFSAYFPDITLVSALYYIGLIPLLYGVYAVFYHTFYTKNKKIYFLMAFTLATAFLLWLKLIKIELGLISLGIIMSVLFSEFYLHIFDYIKKTRFANYKKTLAFCLFIVVLSSSVLPSLVFSRRLLGEAISPQEMVAFQWLRENTAPPAVILAAPNEGHLVTGVAHRKNVLDTNFLRIKRGAEIFEDVTTIYTTRYETEAIKLLNQYGVDYLVVSDRLKRQLPVNLGFLHDTRCFVPVFSNPAVTIYESRCKLK